MMANIMRRIATGIYFPLAVAVFAKHIGCRKLLLFTSFPKQLELRSA
jgi:hypothetical protein